MEHGEAGLGRGTSSARSVVCEEGAGCVCLCLCACGTAIISDCRVDLCHCLPPERHYTILYTHITGYY